MVFVDSVCGGDDVDITSAIHCVDIYVDNNNIMALLDDSSLFYMELIQSLVIMSLANIRRTWFCHTGMCLGRHTGSCFNCCRFCGAMMLL